MSTEVDTQVLALQAQLRAKLRPNERIYVIVDAARGYQLAHNARAALYEGADWHGMLMNGPLSRYLEHIAPHLLEVTPDSDFWSAWREENGRSVGCILFSDAEPEAIMEHARTLFVVSDETGREYSFRFYDPRVLRSFLPTCMNEQVNEFFGPVRVCLFETETGIALMSATPAGPRVNVAGAEGGAQ